MRRNLGVRDASAGHAERANDRAMPAGAAPGTAVASAAGRRAATTAAAGPATTTTTTTTTMRVRRAATAAALVAGLSVAAAATAPAALAVRVGPPGVVEHYQPRVTTATDSPAQPAAPATTPPAASAPAAGSPPGSQASPAAATGRTVSYNEGSTGQCTWWAIEEFHRYSALYPDMSDPADDGNAGYWAINAAHNGWTVTGVPVPESIAVFPPGVDGALATGHVAWVTGVSGGQVTITEMNASAGWNAVDTRTLIPDNSVRYILAPRQ